MPTLHDVYAYLVEFLHSPGPTHSLTIAGLIQTPFSVPLPSLVAQRIHKEKDGAQQGRGDQLFLQ